MRSFVMLTVAALCGAMLCVDDASAQGCSAGCNVGTRQAARVQAEPDPVPQALAKLEVPKSEMRGFKAPEVVAQREAKPLTTLAAYRTDGEPIEAQPVGLNLGFINAGNRDGRSADVEALIARDRARAAAESQRIDAIQSEVAQLRASGRPVSAEEVQRALDQVRTETSPSRMTAAVVSDPQFQAVLSGVVNSVLDARGVGAGPEAFDIEIVPVE